MNQADRIIAEAQARLDAAYGAAADMMAGRLHAALGVQAPLVPGASPPRAATPADPGAIPRRVSGDLQAHVDSQQLGPGEWVFGVRGGLGYPLTLEYLTNHPFFNPIMEESLPEIISTVSDRLRGG